MTCLQRRDNEGRREEGREAGREEGRAMVEDEMAWAFWPFTLLVSRFAVTVDIPASFFISFLPPCSSLHRSFLFFPPSQVCLHSFQSIPRAILSLLPIPFPLPPSSFISTMQIQQPSFLYLWGRRHLVHAAAAAVDSGGN